MQRINNKKNKILSLGIGLLLSCFGSLFTAPSVQAASASFFTSGGGRITTGQNITVTVSVNGSEAYNAVDVTVNFANFTFISATPIGGWTTFSGPTRNGNSVNYVGAIFGGSATGSRNVLSVTLRAPSSPSTATVSSSGTITVLSGNAKVSGGGNTATYTVQAPPAPTPTPRPAPGAVTITSVTHPDQTLWYREKNVQISWTKQDGVSDFSYIIDTTPTTSPPDTTMGGETSKTITDLHTGTYYFHIKAKNDVGWSTVSHFQINIDTNAPDPFSITKIEDSTTNEIILYFATNDSASGVARYTVLLDDEDKGGQASGYRVPKESSKIIVTAIDKAGNSTASTLDLKSVLSTDQNKSKDDRDVDSHQGSQSHSLTLRDKLIIGAAVILALYGIVITVLYIKHLPKHKKTESIDTKTDTTSPLH